jgi:hypothetical protein
MGQLESKHNKQKPSVDQVAQELATLSDQDVARVFEQAKLTKRGFELTQNSAVSADAQLSDVAMPRVESLEDVDTRHHAELREAMRTLVFGASEPSSRGLQRYIDSVCNRDDFSFQERRTISRVLNFWKRELGLTFYIEGQACLLSVPTAAGYGGFRVKTPGNEFTYLSNSKRLPRMECRKS